MSQDPKSKDQIFYLPLSSRPPTPARILRPPRKLQQNPQDGNQRASRRSSLSSPLEPQISYTNTHQRSDAWNHYPYPSIGLFICLDLGLSGDDLPKDDPSNPSATEAISSTYSSILQKLKNGGRFLDVGCMFAQDLRKLVYDGAPPSSVYGTDLRGDYFEYGYKLFRDEAMVPRDQFIAADILDSEA
jgi:hypothetical protein